MHHDSTIEYYVSQNFPKNEDKSNCGKCKTDCNACGFMCRIFIPCSCCKYYSAKVYVTLLCLMILASSMITSGYLSAVSTSIQHQYNMPTSKIGIIMSSFDIMSVFAIPIVSYWGSKANRPRLIAIFSIFYVIGAAIFTLPYFIGPKYTIKQVVDSSQSQNQTFESAMFDNYELCKSENYTKQANNTLCGYNSENTWPYYVFILGQLCMSLGTAPSFSLGLTYLTDNLDERSHGVYTGFVYGNYALGPVLGYVMASFLLSNWVNPTEPKPNILESDPRWVGLWWVGFLISSGFMLIILFLMASFPKRLPNSVNRQKYKSTSSLAASAQTATAAATANPIEQNLEIRDSRLDTISLSTYDSSQMGSPTVFTIPNSDLILNENDAVTEPQTEPATKKSKCKIIFIKFKNFLKSLWGLISKIDYTLIVLAITLESILIAAFTNFMVKYTEQIYQIPPSKSSIYTGGVVVPSAIVGAIIGGILVKKFNLQIQGSIRLILGASTVAILGVIGLLFIYCPGKASIGIDAMKLNYNSTQSVCGQDCNCEFAYSPICGPDGQTYVSACYAGCTYANETEYYDCECISNSSAFVVAKSGKCPVDCDVKFILFMIVLFVIIAAEGLCMTPATLLLLKLVDNSLQSFSLGVMKCITTLLAYIPAPIVFSKLIDNTCVLWNSSCGDDTGACLEHNVFNFHYVFFGVALGVKLLSFLVVVILFFYEHRKLIIKKKYSRKVTLHNRTRRQRDSEIPQENVISDLYVSESKRRRKSLHRKHSSEPTFLCSCAVIHSVKSTDSMDTLSTNLSTISLSDTNKTSTENTIINGTVSSRSSRSNVSLAFSSISGADIAGRMGIIEEEEDIMNTSNF